VASQRNMAVHLHKAELAKESITNDALEDQIPVYTHVKRHSIGSMFNAVKDDIQHLEHQLALQNGGKKNLKQIEPAHDDSGDFAAETAEEKAAKIKADEKKARMDAKKAKAGEAEEAKSKKKTGRQSMMAGATSLFRKSTAPTGTLEVRGLQEPKNPEVEGKAEAPKKKKGGGGGRLPDDFDRSHLRKSLGADALGPANPTALWETEWDAADDGPMPPNMNFSCNEDINRKNLMLKILDMD